MAHGHEVLVRVQGCLGRLTLNRPRALNALTASMCETISRALLRWQEDEEVEAVLIDHVEGRAFCAGGDVRLVAQSGAGDGREARRFFAAEYRMNELLHRYEKPVVAVMDGITMGGGVGLSWPARYRVATENTLWAMPEGDIGLFPDVGAGWRLPRLPGMAGAWLGLSGARLQAADLVDLGIATHFVGSEWLPSMCDGLCDGQQNVADTLSGFAAEAGPAPSAEFRPLIDELFTADQVEEILEALAANGSAWALQQRETISRKCPTTLKVALRLIRRGLQRLDFAEEMAVEYRVAVRMIHRSDFLEGVRAVLIDKDNAPRWDPNTLAGVDESLIDGIFAELPAEEEWTPFPARE